MIRPKNETKDLLLPVTKNCETLLKLIQTHKKHLNSKLSNQRKLSHLNNLLLLALTLNE